MGLLGPCGHRPPKNGVPNPCFPLIMKGMEICQGRRQAVCALASGGGFLTLFAALWPWAGELAWLPLFPALFSLGWGFGTWAGGGLGLLAGGLLAWAGVDRGLSFLAATLLALSGIAGGYLRRRLEALDLENRGLAFLAAVGEAATGSKREDRLLEEVAQRAVARAGYVAAMIWGPEGGELRPLAVGLSRGLLWMEDERAARLSHKKRRVSLPWDARLLKQGFAAPAVEKGTWARIALPRGRPEAGLEAFAWALGARAALLLPIRRRERVWGYLFLAAEEPRAFEPGERQILAEAVRMLGQALDRLRLEREVAELSYSDPLTGVLNRRGFFDRGKKLLKYVRENGRKAAVVYIDLNHFKEVNDAHGHAVGDEVLRQVADRLVKTVRARDLVARLGGDEFAVLLDLDNLHVVENFLSRLMRVLRRPFTVGGHKFHLGASSGVAVFPVDGEDLDELLRKADTAMFRAKREGKRVAFFNPESDEALARRFRLERELKEAILKGEIEVVYQPVRRYPGGDLVFLEALARWKEPPDVFIPLAEEIGLAWELDRLVLDRVLDQLAAWQAHGRPLVSVNLSTRSLLETRLLPFLEEALAARRLPPGSLALELPESPLEQAHTAELLARLWKMGVRLLIDDFGVGFLSLAQIKDLPFDFIELPQTFVKELEESTGALAVAEAVRALGERAGVAVIAEGVETEDELSTLLRLGYGLFKGHYFGPPLTADQAEPLLREASV